MSKRRSRRPSARKPVRRSPGNGAAGVPRTEEAARREEREQEDAKSLLVALLDRTAEGDTEAALAVLDRVLALQPVGRDRYDPAGRAAADMICDVLDEQASALWSDLAGPASLDALVDRFVPLVEAAEGTHEADLRWALEYLGDFRLSAVARARVVRQLGVMAPMTPPLLSATTTFERAERIVQLQGTLVDLLAFAGGSATGEVRGGDPDSVRR